MNGGTFATSRQAGDLVVAAVGLFALALVVAMVTLGEWQKARRRRRAQDLRVQRANLRRPRLTLVGPPAAGATAADRGMANGAQRARAAGVDELLLEDDFVGFAEYGGDR